MNFERVITFLIFLNIEIIHFVFGSYESNIQLLKSNLAQLPEERVKVQTSDVGAYDEIQLNNIKNRIRRNAPSTNEKAEKIAKETHLLAGATNALAGALNLDNILGGQREHKPNTQTNVGPTLPDITQCETSKTTINYEKTVCKQKLIFEDQFNEIDWSKWSRDIRIPLDTEDADFVSFQNLDQNLYVKDGILYILPKLLTEVSGYDDESIQTGTLNLGINCTGTVDRSLECKREAFAFRILPPIVSARITTKNKFTFKYGTIEIRAKLPKGDWLFPQLFLEPGQNLYGISGYSSGQIRLAFIRGNEILETKEGRQIDGYRLFGGVVLDQGENFRELWMKDILKKRNHFGDDYHIYKTVWTDEFISFHVDDVEYGRFNGNFGYEAFDLNNIQHAEYWKTGNKMAPFDKEFFLSLGVSAGGISDFPESSMSGKRESDLKPWINTDAKNELNFWRAKNRWFSTWNGEDAALKIDYVRSIIFLIIIVRACVNEIILEDSPYEISYLDYIYISKSRTSRFAITDIDNVFQSVEITGSIALKFPFHTLTPFRFEQNLLFVSLTRKSFQYNSSNKRWEYRYKHNKNGTNFIELEMKFFVTAHVNKTNENISSFHFGSQCRVYNFLTKKFNYKRINPKQDFNYFLNDFLSFIQNDQPSKLIDKESKIIISKQECKYSKTVINKNQKVCEDDLIFEDNFEKIDLDKWNYDVRIPIDTEDDDFVSFQNLEQNLYVKDGILYILPQILTELDGFDDEKIRTGHINLGNNCTGIYDPSIECRREAFSWRILPPIVSARIRTKNIFSFKYGVVEIRAKLPIGDWLFPQLFLEPESNDYGICNYSSGQIRVAFARGNKELKTNNGKDISGNRLYGGVILSQGVKSREIYMKNILQDNIHFGNEFHIFRTIWTDEYISFMVDDKEYAVFNTSFQSENAKLWENGDKMAPFNKEFFLSLGVSAGGISDFPDNIHNNLYRKPWVNLDPKNELNFWKAKDKWYPTWIGEDAALKIDYVRIWAY
ncbi:uncharacterized protein LOC129613590 [Condylostylus longicornis]|uniref:uncharacterized protein LOC129613590 n=1 Tax=Condylostylus longicornis TaxID=2530218 RepID=UPI00244DC24D|nr:uncharacterized protein LOC129613590 [Condylostylus longicornis]